MRRLTYPKLVKLTPYMVKRLQVAVEQKFNANCNEAIRDAIRDYLIEIRCWRDRCG